MNAVSQAERVAVVTNDQDSTLSNIGRGFEAWHDPPAYEPNFDDFDGGDLGISDLEESLEIRVRSL